MKPARLTAPAKRELRQAVAWYAEKSHGLGRDFASEVQHTLELIEQYPAAGSTVPYMEDDDVFRFPIRRFPFQVVYVELSDRIEILAIADDRRRPGYWKEP